MGCRNLFVHLQQLYQYFVQALSTNMQYHCMKLVICLWNYQRIALAQVKWIHACLNLFFPYNSGIILCLYKLQQQHLLVFANSKWNTQLPLLWICYRIFGVFWYEFWSLSGKCMLKMIQLWNITLAKPLLIHFNYIPFYILMELKIMQAGLPKNSPKTSRFWSKHTVMSTLQLS